MTKINNIVIEGLRGVRSDIDVPLKGKSALLYGDNGSGKSSISDVIEWFYFDKIRHLSDEEIGRNGHEAMRNIFLPGSKAAKLKMDFTTGTFNAEKTLEEKAGKLKSTISNDNDVFQEYLNVSSTENLILRYRDLVDFVLASKTDRLKALSDIIGYSQITTTREVLRSVLNGLSKDIKTKGFDTLISHQQAQIIEQLGQNITSDAQFISVVSKLVEPFKLEIKIKTLADINKVLPKIKKPDDSNEVNQETLLAKLVEKLLVLPANLDEIETQYQEYKKKFDSIVSDLNKLKKVALERLLTVGKSILDGGYDQKDCPLCLTAQDTKKLSSTLGVRISELKGIQAEQAALQKIGRSLSEQIDTVLKLLHTSIADKKIDEEQNAKYKKKLKEFEAQLKKYNLELQKKTESGVVLTLPAELKINRKDLGDLTKECKAELSKIRSEKKADPKWDAYNKIKISGNSYATIRKLKREKEAYETQRDTLEIIYGEFQKRQKSSLEIFLKNFSGRINEIYQYLNPGEKIENIRLVPIEKDDELLGITIQYDFFDSKDVTPPHKFLSESHLNCVGIAFFLSSVEAFNKKNKFLVLDDVISSFDANHRKRFADLLIEQYSEYQLIVLTHERGWFDIVNNAVKSHGWHINTIKFDEERGTHFDEPQIDLKSRIETKIKNKVEDNLGNDSRKYLEGILKDIAYEVGVEVDFKFNDANEDRMANELLSKLKGTIAKRKCTELQSNLVIDRLMKSMFIGNKDSHAGSFVPTFADMKAFWQDVKDFEALFHCSKCGTYTSQKYFDPVNKKLNCKDGAITLTWHK